MKIIELFAGIGACSKALENIGINLEIVDAVEIDKYAIKSFNAVHGTNFEPQDITKWDKDLKDIDIITHGSPCQDFSVAGKQAGGDLGSGTRSSLMYETIRIVGKIRPKYVLWENVKNLLSKSHKHNFDAYIQTMNSLGYTSYYQVLNAKDYGIPQNRERVFTISIRNDINKKFEFPQPQELKLRLKDILEDEVDEKYYLSDEMINKIKSSNFAQEKTRIQEKDYCDTLLARDYKDPKCVEVIRKYGVFDTEKSKHQAESVYIVCEQRCDEGIRFFKDNICGSLRTIDSCGDKRVIENNLKTKLCNNLIENNVVKGGKIINHSYTNSEQRNTLDKYIESDNRIMPTLTTRPDTLGYVENFLNHIRIRKLTPKECWRLMGFDDESFEKAKSVPTSNAQLYKQAGNSIVVKVLEKIFKNLFN